MEQIEHRIVAIIMTLVLGIIGYSLIPYKRAHLRRMPLLALTLITLISLFVSAGGLDFFLGRLDEEQPVVRLYSGVLGLSILVSSLIFPHLIGVKRKK